MNSTIQSVLTLWAKVGILLLLFTTILSGSRYGLTSQTQAAAKSNAGILTQKNSVSPLPFEMQHQLGSSFTQYKTSPESALSKSSQAASFDCSIVTTISNAECQSLVALYKSTDGENWHIASNWLSNPEPCTWYGIMCNKKGAVLTITLGDNNLTGPLPEAVRELKSLQMLGLWNNRLSGTIPTALGQLTELTILDLSNNKLTGTIPQGLGNLSTLHTLWLSDNRLSGSVPTALESLRGMTSLHIERNQLIGVLPRGLTSLPNIQELIFSYNALETDGRLADGKTTAPSVLRSAQNHHNVTTQTVAPNDLQIVQVQKDSVKLAWTPIDYLESNGFYEISYRAAEDSSYTVYGTTDDKSADAMIVNGLLSNTTYHFIIRTYTQPYLLQKNALWSRYSAAVTQKTIAQPTVRKTVVPAAVPTAKPTATSIPLSDLTITALEVTQGLQNLTNDMPLVANRKTWVRVYVQSDRSDVVGVRAQLRAFKGSKELAGSPLAMEYDPVTVRTDGGSRLNLEDSFQFNLPTAWLTGDVTFQAEVNHDRHIQESNPKSNLWEETVTFHSSAPLSLVMVPLKLYEDGDRSQPSHTYKTDTPDFDLIIANSYRYMPVSTIEWREHDQTLEPDCNGPCSIESSTDPKPILHQLEAMRAEYEQVDHFYETANNEHWVGMVDPNFLFGGLSIRVPKSFWQEYNGWSSLVGVYTDSYFSPYEIGGSLALMHEIGHNLGLMHVDCGENAPNPALDYPYAATAGRECSLDQIDESGFYGFDVYYAAAGLDKPVVISNDPAADEAHRAYPMMSYKFPSWPSPYKYCQLLIKFGVECNLYTYQNRGAIVYSASKEPVSQIDLGDMHFGVEIRADLESPKSESHNNPVTDENQLLQYPESDPSNQSLGAETHTVSKRIIEIDQSTGNGDMKLVTVQKAAHGVATSNGQILYYVPQSAEVVDEVISYTLSDQEGRLQEYTFEVPPSAASVKPSTMLPLIVNE